MAVLALTLRRLKKIPIALAGLGLFVQVGCVAKPQPKRKVDTVQLRGIVTVQLQIVRSLPAAQIDELPYFYFACGTEDSSQINSNRKLAELFTQKKIVHEYRESPGEHNWAYWDRQVQAVLKIAALKLRLPDPVQATRQRGVRPTIREASPGRAVASAS